MLLKKCYISYGSVELATICLDVDNIKSVLTDGRTNQKYNLIRVSEKNGIPFVEYEVQ
jgi:hypothetical protein